MYSFPNIGVQSDLPHNLKRQHPRHVYFGHPLNLHYRKSSEYPNMDQLRKQREDQLLKNYILRTAEYERRYKCLIPPAGAFRVFSRHMVDNIVDRLHQPPPRGNRKRESSEDRKVSLRVMTREEKDKSLKRIQKDTAMSMMRERPPRRLVNMGLNVEN